MAEACYTARATTKQQVIEGIGKLALKKTNMGSTCTMLFYFCKKISTASL